MPESTPRYTRENMREKKREIFASTTLTLIAIIQSLAFSLLVSQVNAPFYCLDPLMGLQYFVCFLVIVTIWYEYFWAIWLFDWLPKICDAVIPFLLGALEGFMIYSIDYPDSTFGIRFEIWAGLLSFVGGWAYVNTNRHYQVGDFEREIQNVGKIAKSLQQRAVLVTFTAASTVFFSVWIQTQFSLVDPGFFSFVCSTLIMLVPIALLVNSSVTISRMERMLEERDQQ